MLWAETCLPAINGQSDLKYYKGQMTFVVEHFILNLARSQNYTYFFTQDMSDLSRPALYGHPCRFASDPVRCEKSM